MLFIPDCQDERLFFLKGLFKNKCTKLERATILVMPKLGVNSLGMIKGTKINVAKILNSNIKTLFYFELNEKIKDLFRKNGIDLISFYDDPFYCEKERNLKYEIIVLLATEYFKKRIDEIKIEIIGNNQDALWFKKKIKSLKETKWDMYLHFNGLPKQSVPKECLYIEMNNELQLEMPLLQKNFYWINFLLGQYLTKSGAQDMYDSMVRKGVNL